MSILDVLKWMGRHWVVGLLLLANLAALLWFPFGGEEQELAQEVPETPADTSEPESTGANLEQEQLRAELTATKLRQKLREEARLEQGPPLEELLAALNDDLPPDEYAAHLCAIGNLYQQKQQNYEEAAIYYEELIQRFPEWPGIRSVYHQLITCYSRSRDHRQLRNLYRDMLEVFPENSSEYQYAKSALNSD